MRKLESLRYCWSLLLIILILLTACANDLNQTATPLPAEASPQAGEPTLLPQAGKLTLQTPPSISTVASGLINPLGLAELPDGKIWHRVRLGPFSDQNELNHSREALKRLELEANLIKVRQPGQ